MGNNILGIARPQNLHNSGEETHWLCAGAEAIRLSARQPSANAAPSMLLPLFPLALTLPQRSLSDSEVWRTQRNVDFNSAPGMREGFWFPALPGEGLRHSSMIGCDQLPTA